MTEFLKVLAWLVIILGVVYVVFWLLFGIQVANTWFSWLAPTVILAWVWSWIRHRGIG